MASPFPSLAVTSLSQVARTYRIQNLPPPKQNKNPYDGKIDKTSTRDKELYKSLLGTPVYTDVTLKGGSYTDLDGRTVNFKDMTFVTVLMLVSQAKVIERTTIQGRNGTVKEYIGMDDYKVTINLIIPGKNTSYPIDDVRSLKDILDAPIPIEVVSTHLQNLDIFNLVVDDYGMDQEPGGYSQQNVTINCSSDVPIELQIK